LQDEVISHMNEMKVFISYSHDTAKHTQLVLQLANALRSQGVDVELDQYHVRPPLGWPRWCEEQLRPENAAFVLVICTATYLQRVEGKTAADEGRGVFWEGGIIYNYLYNEKANKRFIPVLLPGAKEDDIPFPLRGDTRYCLKAFDLKDSGYLALYRELTGQPAVIMPPTGAVVSLPPDAQSAVNPLSPLPPRNVLSRFIPADISRIIKYSPEELIGREAETKLLNDAWTKVCNETKKRPHVLTLVALGGEGKTSLVAKWAAEMAGQDWSGCDAVFAWSFYSQGTRDQAVASSDIFFKEALTFFGDPEMAGSAQGAFDKGRRLAQLVGERRALLILDGLEPLQYAPTSPTPGELKDQGLSVLLKGLAASSHALCIVTTRYSIPDLRAYRQTTAPEEKLLRLSNEAGVALLKKLGVKGNQKEFKTLVEDVKGHALTLNLLGTYLRDAHAGDIRKRDLVKLEEADAAEQGGHAFRVMDSYVQWFHREGENGQRALALLSLLGLFDRPATGDCLEALWEGDAIPGLTAPLVGLSEAQRNVVLTRLESAKLLTVNRDAAGTLVSLDAHPLLRVYFAQQLCKKQPEAWRAAHRQLYEHLCATTKEGDQPTLEDLQPLYQAVAHGCQAGLQQEACDKVYRDRIARGREAYSLKKLGALGSDLGAFSCFFETQWSRVSPALLEVAQAWLLGEAAFRLRGLGRLAEALEPLRAGLDMDVQQKNWNEAARSANNLSELKLTLGDLAGALADAEQSVIYADRSGDDCTRIVTRTTHADTLHQAGHRAKAETLFREAEEMQKKVEPAYPLLYSWRGFKYCDLLLIDAERTAWQLTLTSEFALYTSNIFKSCAAVSQRAAQMLKWTEDEREWSIITVALNHLILGRARLYLAILEKSAIRNPISEIEMAMSGFRRGGAVEFLIRGLLTRAWLRSLTRAYTGPESAQADLDEAWEIAERGPMPLFLADILLYRARLFGRQKSDGTRMNYPWESPQADLAEAQRLIEKHGYFRRQDELVDARRAILG